MARSSINKIAREVYARFADSDRDFTKTEVLDAVRIAVLNDDNLAEEAIEALVYRSVEAAEQSEKSKADSKQLSLFEVSGTLILGDDRRRGLKHAQRTHYEESLNIKRANMEAVVAKYRAEEEKYEMLKPYWPDGRSYIQAVDAYLQDNPESKSA